MIKIYVAIVIAVFIRQCKKVHIIVKFFNLFLLNYLIGYCQNFVQTISVSPVNTSVTTGDDVILKCTVNNLQGELTWCRNEFCTFGRNRTITNSRFSIIENLTTIGNILIGKY
jgi:hypothetical protein